MTVRDGGRHVQRRGDFTIDTVGLRALRSALGRLDRRYRRAFDKELRAIARPIARDAQRRYRVLHPRRRPSKGSQRGIRASARQSSSQVVLGGQRYPYLMGQEWGGGQRYPQFPPPRREGRFFWPAILAGMDQVRRDLTRLIDRANRLEFPGR